MHQKDGDSDASSLVPPTGAVARTHGAAAHFEKFAPSRQRQYIKRISEAKSDATRQRRLATAVEWIAQGKPRHWRYQNGLTRPVRLPLMAPPRTSAYIEPR